jgi:hypothetical protein
VATQQGILPVFQVSYPPISGDAPCGFHTELNAEAEPDPDAED